jgi:uncharacterized membrane protein
MSVGRRGLRAIGERASGWWDAIHASFGFLPAVGMLLALGLGFATARATAVLHVELPAFTFASHDSARTVLSTIATVTVSVAGLAFSVTVVAFTLASSQLSPRVLRNFRRDRLSQVTLALLLGTFVYCIVVLVRLGATGADQPIPDLSITVAVAAALVAFLSFAIFISHIVGMLQPSSVIAAIRSDGLRTIRDAYPVKVGDEPASPEVSAAAARSRMLEARPRDIRADTGGFLTLVRGDHLVRAARSADALVRQTPRIGDFVIEGDRLAEVWGGDETFSRLVREAFEIGDERTLVQDLAFPVRQLTDIALKALSPGINDPTTSENAIDAITSLLVAFAGRAPVAAVRVDEDQQPRFVARAPDLDDLVRLGFEQIRSSTRSDPRVDRHLREALARVHRAGAPTGRARPSIVALDGNAAAG